jgi:type IV secretory pathway VirB2 component (pilin)
MQNRTIWLISLVFFSIILREQVFASGAMTDAMCNGYKIFNGPVGKMAAVFAIVALGVGLFMGKITWGLVIAVALGIGAIFGAPKLVAAMTGSAEMCVGYNDAAV